MTGFASPRFSDQEFARRHAAVQAMMRAEGLAALLIYTDSGNGRHNHANLHYLTNLLPRHEAYALVPLEGEPTCFITHFNHVPTAQTISAVADTRFAGVDPAASVAERAREVGLGTGRLGIVGRPSYQDYLRWREALPGVTFADATVAYRRLRLVKSAEELEWQRRGAHFCDLAAETLERDLHPGAREYELADLVERSYRPLGGEPHFAYISSTPMRDSRVCVPSQELSDRTIHAGDVLNFEISASYGGYSGQILRPIFVGEDPTPAYRRLADVALEAYARVAAVLRPGATEQDVLAAGAYIDGEGFTIRDALLHGFGVDLQAPSLMTPGSQHRPPPPFTFQENMTVVIQPNVITKDERMGVQIGNLVRITGTGIEPLQRFPLRPLRVG
jgi:Xaa-Pro aminopeptidase